MSYIRALFLSLVVLDDLVFFRQTLEKCIQFTKSSEIRCTRKIVTGELIVQRDSVSVKYIRGKMRIQGFCLLITVLCNLHHSNSQGTSLFQKYFKDYFSDYYQAPVRSYKLYGKANNPVADVQAGLPYAFSSEEQKRVNEVLRRIPIVSSTQKSPSAYDTNSEFESGTTSLRFPIMGHQNQNQVPGESFSWQQS